MRAVLWSAVQFPPLGVTPGFHRVTKYYSLESNRRASRRAPTKLVVHIISEATTTVVPIAVATDSPRSNAFVIVYHRPNPVPPTIPNSITSARTSPTAPYAGPSASVFG